MRRSKSDVSLRSFETALGWCAVARSGKCIIAMVLPCADRESAEAKLLRRSEGAKWTRSGMSKLVKAVRKYFDGWTTSFGEFALDLSSGTPFQQRVWGIVRRIPYGEVRTYYWVGLEMGRPGAVRAIGGALGANPTPLLVPCHRVVAVDGALCGFSAEGGLDLKARMLEMEGIRISGRRVMPAHADSFSQPGAVAPHGGNSS